MRLEERRVRFTSSGEAIEGQFARPAGIVGALPAVIVVHEIWGIDPHVEDLVQRFAAAGYVALAPDLYSRGGKPPVLAPDRIEEAKALLDKLPPAAWRDPLVRAEGVGALPDDARRRVGPTLERLLAPQRPTAQWVGDLCATVAWLQDAPEARGRRIGAVGFCVGGNLAALLATEEPALSASASFYGAAPPPERADDVRCPMLGLYAGDDPRVLATVGPFADAMARAGKGYERHVYPDTPHAFFNDTRRSYRPEAARDAWWRLLRFLSEALAPVP